MFNSNDFHPYGTQRTWPDGSALHLGHSMADVEAGVTGRTPIRDLSPNLPQCVRTVPLHHSFCGTDVLFVYYGRWLSESS